jgi:hypothetical protein
VSLEIYRVDAFQDVKIRDVYFDATRYFTAYDTYEIQGARTRTKTMTKRAIKSESANPPKTQDNVIAPKKSDNPQED